MSTVVENGNPAHFGSVAALDRRIDNIDREFGTRIDNLGTRLDSSVTSIRNEVAGRIDRLSSEQRDQTNELSNKIERSQRSTNPYQLIFVMLAIGGAASGAGIYVAKNLSDNQVSASEVLAKSIKGVNETLTKDVATNAKAISDEGAARIEQTRRMYDIMEKNVEKAWSKDAHLEYEKRIDEKGALERDYVRERLARDERDYDHLTSIIVPREDETQYRESVTRELGQLARTTGDSLDRVTAHLNKSDERNEARAAEQDKALHGYGLTDEVKQSRETQREFGAQLLQLYQLLAGGRIGGALNAPSQPKSAAPAPAD